MSPCCHLALLASLTPRIALGALPPIEHAFVHGRDEYSGGASTLISVFKPDENLSQLPTVRIRSSNARKALLRWDGLQKHYSRQSIVRSAKLRLYVTTCRNPEGSDITVHQVLTQWDAAAATWHYRRADELWGGPGMRVDKDFDAEPMGKVRGPGAGFKGWLEIPLNAEAVQQWLSMPKQNFGVVIKVAAEAQPGVDDQFYGNAGEDVSRRPQLVIATVPGNPPAPVVALRRLILADFALPAYLNRDTATLVLEPTELVKEPVALGIHFKERETGQSPVREVSVTVRPGQGRATLPIEIGDWPDGEYLTTIRQLRSDGRDTGTLVRLLRKQTLAAPAPPREPIDVAALTMLFVDDWYLQQREGLRFKVHPARLNAVTTGPLSPDRIMQRGLRLRLEQDGTFVLKLKDMDRYGENPRYYTARSRDGKSWDITQDRQATRNGESGVVRCAAKASGRYRFYDAERDGPVPLDKVRIKYSKVDGSKWGEIEVPPRSAYPIWEKTPGEFVVLTRNPLTLDRSYYTEGHLDEWHHTNDNYAGYRLSRDGKTLHYCQGRAIVRFPPFRVEYDNLWAFNRILVNWSTGDGINWTPSYFSLPTEADPIGYQHYGARIFPVEDKRLWLAYLFAYDQAKQQIYFELNYSRDGLFWCRFKGEPAFAANGPPGSWNFGSMFPVGWGPVEKDGLIYRPIGYASNAPHFVHEFIYKRDDLSEITPEFLRRRLESRNLKSCPHWPHFGSWEALCRFVHKASQTIGVMVYRKNGWTSVRPEHQRGSLVTKALAAGKTLSINANTGREGKIVVEVLSADGEPLAPYCGDNAAVFTGDATAARLSWSRGEIEELPGAPIRLRIAIDRADLFSLNW